MKKNIGKSTLGDNNKMQVTLKGYGRSTHDLSYAWRSPMGVGTLVPFMKFVALPEDGFEIDMDTLIMTHPTVGPLFGTFKFQADIFTCPIRLYNAMLHNNALNIGLDMAKVKLPVAEMDSSYGEGVEDGTTLFKTGKGSIGEYFGMRGESRSLTVPNTYQTFQIVPFLAYYDIFKNYYANKQEERFHVMGGSKIQNATTVESTDFTGYINAYPNITYLMCTVQSTITITGTDVNLETINKIKFTIDTQPIYLHIRDKTGQLLCDTVSDERNKIIIKTKKNQAYQVSKKLQGNEGESITLKGTTENITQGTITNTYTSSYPLTEIDDLREYILSLGKKQFVISKDSDEALKKLFIYNVFQGKRGTPDDQEHYIKPLTRKELGGLCLKTHQSDIYNNWVNTEWIDGDNGIAKITGVAVTEGKFTIDALNLAQKVYNMLNRIAVSGGTYKDWIETVYDTEYYFRAETPVYEGGMSTMIDFEPVVSNSSSAASGIEEPLGSLAGKGVSGKKNGGTLKIKITEPSYIIGIASITPLVDYSQGNDWDLTQLTTLDDLHKPGLDAIGYQDLMTNTMHWAAKMNTAIGKQPAWMNYMTNVNKSYGDFAAGEKESYMVLNRIYNVDKEGNITNATTYINPKDYTYIFATNTDTNTDFWVQIGCKVKARRVMSAKQIPLM